jgi:hypothetical protein
MCNFNLDLFVEDQREITPTQKLKVGTIFLVIHQN